MTSKTIFFVATLLCRASAGGTGPYDVYTASLTQLSSSGVTGSVTIFVTPTGVMGIGAAAGLEASLASSAAGGTSCSASNGCGVHVHSGTACTDSTTQGGHYYTEATDPWATIGYSSTTAAGAATFSFDVTTEARSIAGKPFVVHNNAGERVACGLLAQQTGVKIVNTAALDSSGVTGTVTLYTTATGVIGAGSASGLEASLADSTAGGTSCSATNGCGVHVHSGSSCDDTTTQGGHYYAGSSDPWSTVRYSSTTSAGSAHFIFSVTDSATAVLNKPFIVHNNAGSRVSCGIIMDPPYTAYTATLTALDSSGVTGEVTVFATPTGLLGIGSAAGLEASLANAANSGTSCTATNGCGVHVHAGSACTDTTTQGGHYYTETVDPWSTIGYATTTAAGASTFSFSVPTAAKGIANKPFIVHNNAGGRVACGLLVEVTGLKTSSLAPLSSSTVTGGITLYTTGTKVIGAGHADGLEASLADSSAGGSSCTATNGCGVHVHSGTACTDTTTQGGHYYAGSTDPWSAIRYSSTTAAGHADYIFSVTDSAQSVTDKPFIVHNNAGSRVACGLVSAPSYRVFTASLTALSSSGVTAEVTIFQTSTGLLGAGTATGLEASLADSSAGGTSCTASNGCGVHVHSGTACTDTTTQGGHYYAEATDPWSAIRYASTTAAGAATFSFSVTTDAKTLGGKPFVVHNNAGERVACGLLYEVTGAVRSANLAALSSSGVTGEVTVFTTSTMLYGAGHANGLEASLADASAGGSSCTATNGCGVHVHSGTACTDTTTQGGHYYTGSSDPWAAVRYSSTTAAGAASYVFMLAVADGAATNVSDKPFVVHNNAGGRVACGLLGDDGETAPSKATTTTPNTTANSSTTANTTANSSTTAGTTSGTTAGTTSTAGTTAGNSSTAGTTWAASTAGTTAGSNVQIGMIIMLVACLSL